MSDAFSVATEMDIEDHTHMAVMDIAQAIEYGCRALEEIESATIDCQLLLCHVLDCNTSYLHSWSDKVLDVEQQEEFERLISLRQQQYPVAYITGLRGFWTLDLIVTEDTLIPRPDTELLVSLALDKVKEGMLVADLGTGTGAIALSLAKEVRSASFIAMDCSWSALQVAKQNKAKYQLDNVLFWQGSWLSAVASACLDLVVSNPPYIEQGDPHLKRGDVRFEPVTALSSGYDGLDDIRQIIEQAKYCLKPLGWLMIEHGYKQAEQVVTLFEQAGFTSVISVQDYGGNDRVVMGRSAV